MLVADLEAAEVPVPPAIAEQLKRALSAFLRTATVPAGAAADARTAIHLASRAIAELCEDVVLQQIYLHRSARGPLPSLLAGPVAETPLAPAQARSFLDAFQAVSLAMRWRDLQPTQEVTHFKRLRRATCVVPRTRPARAGRAADSGRSPVLARLDLSL